MLRLDSVSYSYPHAAHRAVDDVSLHVKPGELLLCTGQSGCGKSTLIRILNGLIPHSMHGALQGQAWVGGRNTREESPASLAQTVGSLFQDPERQFFALTVGDEIAFALQWRGWTVERITEAVQESAARLNIAALLGHNIFELSEGQKQKVALAALLAARPLALLLDEPSANLDPEATTDLARTLDSLKKEGLAIMVADHRLSWLRTTADRVLVLHAGNTVASGSFSLLDDAPLRARYGLRNTLTPNPVNSLPARKTIPHASFFGCRNLSFSYRHGPLVLNDVSLNFSPGDIVALIGENGAGKTTLARLFTGLEKPSGGGILLRDTSVSARELPRHVQVVLQNAGYQLRMRSVTAELDDAAAIPIPDRYERERTVVCIMAQYGLDTLSDRHPQSLSGGEKQRLAVACAAIRAPKVLILDEPTSGLDGKNMHRIADSIRQAAAAGAADIVITHDLELMNEVCTSKIVLNSHTPHS